MLTISKVALVIAALGLGAMSGAASAAEQHKTTTSSSGFTSTLTIPTIAAIESTMDEAALRDALSGGFSRHADELAKLSAASITIPTITLDMTVTTDGEARSSTVTYKDIMLTGVKDGVAASASIGSTETSSDTGSFKLGRMSTSSLDIGAILALYSSVPGGDASQPMKTLYKDFSFEGGSLSAPEVSCTFGKVTTAEFDARPLKVSFAAMMEAAETMDKAKDDPPPEAVATFVTFMTDIFQAFRSEPLNLDGLNCTGTGDDGKPFELGIGGVTMSGYQPGIYPAITIKDVKIASGTDSVALGSATFKPTDLRGPIAEVEAQGANLSPAWLETNYRKLVPAFGGFSLSGLAVDVPDPEKPDSRITANIADFDLSLSDYVNGIPTKISTKASGVDVPLPDESDDENVQMLKALGINRVNLGYEFSAAWDKATETIKVDKVSVSGADLGSFMVAAVIGNAAEQLFDVDPKVEGAAAMGVTLKSLILSANDAGIGDKLVPMLAEQQHQDPAQFRTQTAGVAEGAALQLLGSTDAARQLGAAVGDFIAGKAKSLTVTVTAKDQNGLTVPQLMQAGDNPALLSNAVEITGKAE